MGRKMERGRGGGAGPIDDGGEGAPQLLDGEPRVRLTGKQSGEGSACGPARGDGQSSRAGAMSRPTFENDDAIQFAKQEMRTNRAAQ